MSKDKDKKDEDNSECKSNKGLEVSFLKRACDSHVLVVALVATISFAAGFTLPSGYIKDSDDTSILSKKPAFQAVVLLDFMALV